MNACKLFAALLGMVLVAAHAATGDLDATFGTGSSVITTILTPGDDTATSVAIQPNGKIVVAGECQFDFCVARYNANGTLDTTFNTTRKVITPVGAAADLARAVALQSDGKIVVAGSCDYEILASPQIFAAKFCMVRYTTAGALDASFNGTGKLLITCQKRADGQFETTPGHAAQHHHEDDRGLAEDHSAGLREIEG